MQSYGSKGDFFWNSPFVPLHDWCKFWSDIFINSGDIAHWNMEKLPILYNGNFRRHGNVCYVFRINPYFCKLHRIGPSNTCVNFEKNRLNIDDFRSQIPFFINSTISHWLTYKIVQIFKWPWPLTFIWPWLGRFEEIHFFSYFFKSRDVKTWRLTSKRNTKAPFYNELFATNQKSLSLPVQKLWPIMWFSLIFFKSRDVQRWRTSKQQRLSCRSGIL